MKLLHLATSILALLALCCSATQGALIAHYEFPTATPTADTSGNGYALTQAGTVTYGSATVNGVSLRTATVTNGASTSANALSRTAGGFGSTVLSSLSISLWGNFNSTQLNDDMVSASNGTGGWELQNTASNTQYGVFHYTTGTTSAGSALGASGVTTSAWHHFVITQNAGSLSLYVDGIFKGTNATAITGTLSQLYLFRGGAFNSGSARGWNGSIADVQVYDEALSQAQVSGLFSNPGTVAIPEPGTIGVIALGLFSAVLFRRNAALLARG